MYENCWLLQVRHGTRYTFVTIILYLLYLICNFGSTPHKVSLSCHRHQSSNISIHGHRLVTVSVLEDYVGDPQHAHLHVGVCTGCLYKLSRKNLVWGPLKCSKSNFNPVHVFLHFNSFCLVVLKLILASKLSEWEQFENFAANYQCRMQ